MSNSEADSSQTQLQESQDNRISGGAGSVNLVTSRSSVGGDVNVTTTDFGTVEKSFNFAAAIAQGAANSAAASSGQVATIAKDALTSVKNAYGDYSDKLGAAYETSKAGEQKIMVAAALAVVALVAIRGGK